MRITTFLTAVSLLGLAACHSSNGYLTLSSGLKYKIYDAHTGAKAKIGDYMKLQIMTTVGDSVLIDTHSMGPRDIPLQKGVGRFDVMEGLALLSSGDSAVFLIPADSVMKGPARPPFVKKGDTIAVHIKVLSIESAQQRNTEAQREMAAQVAKDDSTIADYLAAHHLTGTPTKMGVYIVIQKEGTGDYPKEGDVVSINYTGKTLEGKVFDSNVDTSFHHEGKPLTFPVGIGEMIKGMDDGVMHLKKGAKASLYLPSSVAYGAQGYPPAIDPNSNLEFDVEVLDIKSPKKQSSVSLGKPTK